MHPDPEGPSGADDLICEATYGDRDRLDATAERRRAILRDEMLTATNPYGALLIPSFSVERAQERISDLSRLIAEGAFLCHAHDSASNHFNHRALSKRNHFKTNRAAALAEWRGLCTG